VRAPILVTGGAGFVGSHLVERLVETGARVRCLVRRTSSLGYLLADRVELVYGDLAEDKGLTEALDGVETVFHLAGTTKAASPDAYYRGNAGGTEHLLRACERQGGPALRLIHVSSLAAAGPSRDALGIAEDAEPHPVSHYGKSKLAAERAVRSSRLGASATIVRPAVVYGPRDIDVLEVFRSVARGVLLKIGLGDSYFSFIHVRDLAGALLAAAESPRAAGGTYFAANPAPVSWREFAARAASIMNRRFTTVTAPRSVAYLAGWGAELVAKRRGRPTILSRDKIREARHRYWVCRTGRAQEDLGFVPSFSLETGIAHTLAWYKSVGWLAF
jgi:nucleoside-diphosphate-sugar epimerase